MTDDLNVTDASNLATAGSAQPVTPRASRRGRPAATIYDIAKLAGVNPSTVSRALSKPGRINVKTEERIQAAAKELNYRLNPMARALPTGRSSTLGLLLADITNPMFFDVVRGAERAASLRGYTLILAESQESADRESAAAERLSPSVDGLVLVTSRMSDAKIVELTDRQPLVVINREVDGVPGIVPDIAPGIDEALAHLGGLGHTAIGFVSGPENSWMNRARWAALLVRAPQRGMTIVEIGPGVPTLDGGAAALDRVSASGVSAVLAYNDLMAIGLMRAAQARGLTVPGDLSIIGFDDIFGSDFTSPQLSTVRTPLGSIGERAVRLILDVIDEDAGESPHREIGPQLITELVVRGSTGPAAR
ncbi:LacI family DNA-binding transcriptional regulator [Cryobacterium melibiosiphilum]|uniref:LacI family DNA-binding transcriptional regulator n=1 Tax=Cryobacterium melibiosiphilum TaxID=995039 RepID=UPI001F29075D|nr:LacI family DNA-binding transcriptional regulator [Cryobacterium melibiosiphilum]